MHHALYLEEILLNIFGQCYLSSPIGRHSRSGRSLHGTADLAALARTCRTFKEPALDVLWTELTNLSPLARCLSEASHRIYPGCTWYSFSRPLKQAEWDILRSYTRRVRFVWDFTRGLNWESVKTLFNPPTPEPLFPNLRHLCWEFIRETFPLMHHLAVSSLTSLEIHFVFGDVPPFHSFPQSLGDLCPNIQRLSIRMHRPQVGSDDAISALVCRWRNLRVLNCPYVSLDGDSLAHLSHRASLTNLSFTLSTVVVDHIASSNSILLFPKLRELEMSSQSLELVSRLLPYVRLPAVESLTVHIDNCPSKCAFRTYLIGVQKICTPHSLLSFRLIQTRSPSSSNPSFERYQLTFEDIEPCMTFNHLRRIDINIGSTVDLADDDLLKLASAWPCLECLLVNEEWGWRTEGGITPNGLVRLLQKLESLHHFCLAIDTRGYVRSTRVEGITPRVSLSVNVADSMIQPGFIDALGAFFGRIMEPHATVSSLFWSTAEMEDRLDSEISRKLWEDVFMKAHERLCVHSRSPRTIPFRC